MVLFPYGDMVDASAASTKMELKRTSTPFGSERILNQISQQAARLKRNCQNFKILLATRTTRYQIIACPDECFLVRASTASEPC